MDLLAPDGLKPGRLTRSAVVAVADPEYGNTIEFVPEQHGASLAADLRFDRIAERAR